MKHFSFREVFEFIDVVPHDEALEAFRLYIAELLEAQREACARAMPDDRYGEAVRETPLVEIK